MKVNFNTKKVMKLAKVLHCKRELQLGNDESSRIESGPVIRMSSTDQKIDNANIFCINNKR